MAATLPSVVDRATALSILGGSLALYWTRNYLNAHLLSAFFTAGVTMACFSAYFRPP